MSLRWVLSHCGKVPECRSAGVPECRKALCAPDGHRQEHVWNLKSHSRAPLWLHVWLHLDLHKPPGGARIPSPVDGPFGSVN